jgi:hypothetical protein
VISFLKVLRVRYSMNFYMYRLSHPPGVYVLIRCLSVLMEKYLVKVGCGCHVAWNIRVDT